MGRGKVGTVGGEATANYCKKKEAGQRKNRERSGKVGTVGNEDTPNYFQKKERRAEGKKGERERERERERSGRSAKYKKKLT